MRNPTNPITDEPLTLAQLVKWAQVSAARLSVDMAELHRTAALANMVGKITKAYAEQMVAYRRAGITPTHENLPFFLPEAAESEQP